jgi:hypothetical protein
VKSMVPGLVCLVGLLMCTWRVYRNRPENLHYNVEITVTGPDGKIIRPIRHR